MSREEWFAPKWKALKIFGLLALLGVGLLVASAHLDGLRLVIGIVFLVPLLLWLVLVPLFHWKDRYIGEHSNIWGACVLLETTGWLKILYLFRHIIPDWRQAGRYSDVE